MDKVDRLGIHADGSFDELQLLDASSAALLRDVLSWYWRFGGVIISCSVSSYF